MATVEPLVYLEQVAKRIGLFWAGGSGVHRDFAGFPAAVA
jgi:hypothetical protein